MTGALCYVTFPPGTFRNPLPVFGRRPLPVPKHDKLTTAPPLKRGRRMVTGDPAAPIRVDTQPVPLHFTLVHFIQWLATDQLAPATDTYTIAFIFS